MLQKLFIRHIGTVDRIDVATRTDVYAYIFALFCREVIEHTIIEFYKMRQRLRVVQGLRGHPRCWRPSVKSITTCAAPASSKSGYSSYFVHDIMLKLLARIARQIAIERVKQIHHRRRNHRLVQWFFGHFDSFLD